MVSVSLFGGETGEQIERGREGERERGKTWNTRTRGLLLSTRECVSMYVCELYVRTYVGKKGRRREKKVVRILFVFLTEVIFFLANVMNERAAA